MKTIIIIILCVFFSIALPSASTYGIWSIVSHWNPTSIKIRQQYSLLLMIVLLLLTSVGFFILIIVFLIENQWTAYTFFFTNAMLIGLYSITSYRTWMSFYKSKFQLCLGRFDVDEMLRVCDKSEASNYLETTGAPIGVRFGSSWEKCLINRRQSLESSWTMSKVFAVFSLSLVIVNIVIGCNASGTLYDLDSPYKAYDCYNIVVSITFFIFNLILTCCTRCDFRDSSRCTGEVPTLYCYLAVLAVGFSVGIWVTTMKSSVDDRLVITIIIWMTMLLIIQLIMDWKLYQETIRDCLTYTETSLRNNFTIDDILNNTLTCRQFEQHLRKEFSLENLNFIKACDRYQDLLRYSNDYIDSSGADNECSDEFLVSFCSSKDGLRRKTIVARYIYEQFCAEGAPQEINLSKKIRQELREVFESSTECYAEEVFDDAVDCIKDLLTNDSLLRFQVESGDFYSRL